MRPLRVLVACEYSGTVRDAFLRHGHDAISCDLQPTRSPGPHVVGDVRPLLRERWDIVVAHPPCTYLCNSGVQHLFPRVQNQSRWADMANGAAFFLECLWANSDHVAVENPIMHKHAVALLGGLRASQIVQPWQHGHSESKAALLWLRGLPPLMATCLTTGRSNRSNNLAPGPERANQRALTFAGIAEAMADQWGDFVCRRLPGAQNTR